MKWSEEYATGFEQIDRQHKMLFTMSEDFRSSLDEGSGRRAYPLLLDSLHAYARAHFGIEEHCMLEHKCPFAERNRQAHVQFMDALEGFRERYRVRGFSRGEAYELVQFVDGWLASHIAGIDTQLRHCRPT
jgi:hemerythrin-like metal-binding protein